MSDGVVEVITGRERRRRWSIEDKLRIVAATYEPGACVRQVAAANDVYPALLFTWRRQVRDGKLVPPAAPVFLPVHTAGRPATALPDAGDKPNGRPAGQIEIELKDGSRVRVDADVSLASLRRVIAALRG
jgi:transposase